MIGNRILFVCITLFLVMVMMVSTAPVDDGEVTTPNEIIETTTVPDVVTDDLLFSEVTAVPLDIGVKMDDDLLFHKEGVMPVTPEPDEPYSLTI